MAFDRDDFIRQLVGYYGFCQRIFWDVEIEFPPEPEGWPDLTRETLAKLEFTDAALDLVRHLPYPKYDGNHIDSMPKMMYATPVVDYRHPRIQELLRRDDKVHWDWMIAGGDRTPACVGIAMSNSLHGYHVLVNTDDGYVYLGDPQGGIDMREGTTALKKHLLETRPDDVCAPLRGYNIYEPADFFKYCKDLFREMNFIPEGQDWISYLSPSMFEFETIDEEVESDDDDHNIGANRMVNCGWPGDGEGYEFDRAKYQRLLRRGHIFE